MKSMKPKQRAKSLAASKPRRPAAKPPTPQAAVAITFRHVEPTPAIRSYAERKFARIARHFKRSCEVHLILAVDKYRQCGEVTLKSGRLEVTAREETRDLYSVIDLLADKAGRQLRSHLEKSSTRRMRAPSTGAIMTAVEET